MLLLSALITGCDPDDLPEARLNIDPAAVSISFSLHKNSKFQGQVTITGIVKNVGDDDFVSDPGQQGVYLYEEVPGVSPRVVATADFTTLQAGDSLKVVYSRSWDVSNEFPPNYILRIAYDPDIYLDSKETNDDANNDNNRLQRNGSAINELF